MKKLASLLLAVCLLASLLIVSSSAGSEKSTLIVRVVGRGSYIISGGDSVNSYDNAEKTSRIQLDFANGTSFTVTAVPKEGYEFLYWTNISGRAIFSETIEFTLLADASYSAVFAQVSPSEEGSTHRVVFLDFSGKVAKSTNVAHGGSASAPTNLSAIPEMRHAKWSRSFENITENTVIRPLYSATVQREITVTGGKVGVACIADGGLDSYEYVNHGFFDYNSVVILKADEAPEGMNFAGWSADGGNSVFTTDPNYSFPVGANMNITAVYAQGEIVKTPHISLLSAEIVNGCATFLSIRNLPDDCVFIESGIIISDSATAALTLADVDGTTVLKGSTIKNTGVGEYSLSKTGASGTWRGRAYLAYRNSANELIVIYSETLSVTA